MQNGSFYDTLAALNEALYDNISEFNGWKVIDTYTDRTGLFIQLFEMNEDTIIFAIKGTDFKPKTGILADIIADLSLVKKEVPAQYKNTENYYKQATTRYKNIIITGYSLGGTLAQMLGSKYGNETVTFEAFPAGSMATTTNTGNIINFGNLCDPVFKADFKNHIGKVYIMPVKGKSGNIKYHYYKYYGKPSQAKEFSGTPKDINSIYTDTEKAIQQVKQAKDYVTKGIIPSVKDKVNNISKKAQKQTKAVYQKLHK